MATDPSEDGWKSISDAEVAVVEYIAWFDHADGSGLSGASLFGGGHLKSAPGISWFFDQV